VTTIVIGLLVVFLAGLLALKLAIGFIALALKVALLGLLALGVFSLGKMVFGRRR
jgi:hypothetical protein